MFVMALLIVLVSLDSKKKERLFETFCNLKNYLDQTDELRCAPCNLTSSSKGSLIHCGERKCMSDRSICDGACKYT